MRCRRSRPTIYADRLERLRARADEHGLRPARRLRGPRAQREPRVPDGLRPALRGGDARRRPVRRAGHPGGQRVLRHGRSGAAADAAAPVPGLQPAEPAARPLAAAGRDPRRRGHRHGQPGRRDRLEAVRRPPSTIEVPAFIVDELRADDARRVGRERRRPAHRRRRRPPRDQRGRAAGGVRVRGVPDLAAASGGCSHGLRPGMREDDAVAAPRVERHAALVPPDALERRPGTARAAQPQRPADRARRPVHGRVRDLGCAELPRGIRRRGRRPSCRRRSATTWSGWSGPTSRRSRSGTAPCASARRAARSTRSSQRHLGDPFFGIFLNPGHQLHLDEWVNSPIAPGSHDRAALGHGAPGRHHPRDRHRVLHDEHRGRRRARRRVAAGRVRRRGTRTPWARIQARRRFMADALGIELHPDVLPFSNIPAWLPPFLLRPERVMTLAG